MKFKVGQELVSSLDSRWVSKVIAVHSEEYELKVLNCPKDSGSKINELFFLDKYSVEKYLNPLTKLHRALK